MILTSDGPAMYVARYANNAKDKPFYTVTIIDEEGTPFRLFCSGQVYDDCAKLEQGQSIQPRLRVYSGQNGRAGVQMEGFFTVK